MVKRLSKSRTVLLRKYNTIERKRIKQWDYYFGKTPLSNPKRNIAHHTKANKLKLVKLIRQKENIKRKLLK